MHLRINATQRRSTISSDETRSSQIRPSIDLLLHEQKTHDRLRAGHQHARLGKIKTIRKRHRAEGGAGLLIAGDGFRHPNLSCANRRRILTNAVNAFLLRDEDSRP